MMLDFTPVRNKEITLSELTANLTSEDLYNLTNEMVDTMLALIEPCTDEDVTFQPDDPDAYDAGAATEEEKHLAWTLGHVIVHATASAEETAVIAAALARGVTVHERSRYETPWPTVTTIAQCRQRLEESRRIRLASLSLWPDEPHLDNLYQWHPKAAPLNATAFFVFGLRHDDDHLGQLAEIVRQATATRA